MRNETKIFLNDWANYNDGSIGYGWKTPQEALDYIEEHEDEDREWFIADIDNYLGVDFGELEYSNVEDICNQIMTLEELEDYELDEVIAVMEYRRCDADEAISNKDIYCIYADEDSYLDSCDELIDWELNSSSSSIISRYFDYEAYHRDCMFDVYEASNGVIIVD